MKTSAINASITGDYPVSDDWTAVGTLSLAGRGNTRIGIDPLFRENQMTQDPYWLVNLTAGAKRGHFSIFGYAENLTNRLYATSNQSAELLRDNGVLGATGSDPDARRNRTRAVAEPLRMAPLTE